MNIQLEKEQLIDWIHNLSDPQVLERLHVIRSSFQDDANTSKGLEMASIERGLSDIKNNRVHQHSEVRKRYEKYL